MTTLELTADEAAIAGGAQGEAARLAMRIVTRYGAVTGAPRLIPISGAHIDACMYHGQASLDFVDRLLELGGKVAVPTTLNVGTLDLLHPELSRIDEDQRDRGRRVMYGYARLGARPTWTCAPYQEAERPGFGEDVAWAESNAIVFANSVLGARTDRYGDFLDICAAIVARVPYAGLHVEENRRATVCFDASDLPDEILAGDLAYALLGFVIGTRSGSAIPALAGVAPGQSEDRIKALGAAAASSGGVALVHVVGTTPEAPSLEAATQGQAPRWTHELTLSDLRAARQTLNTAAGSEPQAISVGTPHFSLAEFGQLASAVKDAGADFTLPFYVNTSRYVLSQADDRGWVEPLRSAGATIVVDTCTYVTPILGPDIRVVMTNSAKWAYYAPANLGIGAMIADLDSCVASAVAGRAIEAEGGLFP
jgi:predicted aconitase